MNIALHKPMTLSEFLAWEERQELRYEFDGFGPVAMAGGDEAHETIKVNLIVALANRLRGKPCRPFGSDMKIEVMGRIRYPDAHVTCAPFVAGNNRVRDPVVIFEVLSESTARVDRIDKNREYQATSSVRRYVMLEKESVAATVFERSGDDWVGHVLTDTDVLRMPEIGIELPLAELYEGVDLSSVRDEAGSEPRP
ncbi:MAG: Uma2 family endonuclease [Acetobacteraceae bacterium]|nr:Uma2 family endonuclease [Acetobacteraceae bacterium]